MSQSQTSEDDKVNPAELLIAMTQHKAEVESIIAGLQSVVRGGNYTLSLFRSLRDTAKGMTKLRTAMEQVKRLVKAEVHKELLG